jgi:hypothetical protein
MISELERLILGPWIWNVEDTRNNMVSVFCTGKNRVVKIARSNSEMVLQTTKHSMIYPGLGPSSKVTNLRLAV